MSTQNICAIRPPLIFHADSVPVQASVKALISWENQEIEKYASRLRQFDSFETLSTNVYGNDNIFIIIFVIGYSNWREIHGKI